MTKQRNLVRSQHENLINSCRKRKRLSRNLLMSLRVCFLLVPCRRINSRGTCVRRRLKITDSCSMCHAKASDLWFLKPRRFTTCGEQTPSEWLCVANRSESLELDQSQWLWLQTFNDLFASRARRHKIRLFSAPFVDLVEPVSTGSECFYFANELGSGP